MATWPTCGKRGYITPAVLGVPNVQHGDNNAKWLLGPHVGKEATSPLPSWGSPTLNAGTTMRNGYLAHMWAKRLHHPCRLGGPQHSTRGQQCEMATWATCGQRGYITPTVLGVPNTQCRDKNLKWLLGPHVGKVATSAPAVLGVPNAQRGDDNEKGLLGPHVGKEAPSPLPSLGSPTLNAGTTMRNGYLAHMWAKWLHHPCRLGGPQRSTQGQQ